MWRALAAAKIGEMCARNRVNSTARRARAAPRRSARRVHVAPPAALARVPSRTAQIQPRPIVHCLLLATCSATSALKSILPTRVFAVAADSTRAVGKIDFKAWSPSTLQGVGSERSDGLDLRCPATATGQGAGARRERRRADRRGAARARRAGAVTLCGGHISPILAAAKAPPHPRRRHTRQATAVFAADAMARLTGAPGVAAVTGRPRPDQHGHRAEERAAGA